MSQRPLAGVRVLDLTNVLAGPYCTYQLALLGAEVLKVEIPGSGDLARHLGADPDLNEVGLGTSFLAQNAGKQSVELDLKIGCRSEGIRRVGQRSGCVGRELPCGRTWPPRFRLARAAHAESRPHLLCHQWFGQTGPMSQAPAYDQVIQGLSGMMSITGTPETAPLRVGFPVCDAVGGLTAALAVASAIAGRHHDGQGCFLDVSMLEASLSAMGWAVSNYLVAGVAPQPMGDQNATAVPSGTFDAADGPLNIAANRQEQFERLCRCVDRSDLLTDPRFARGESRKLHREALNRELNRALATRPASEWERVLTAAGVPAARILTVPEAVELEQLAHRRFFTEVPFPGPPASDDRTVRVSGSGVLVNGHPLHASGPAPLLGEHNEQLDQIVNGWIRARPGRTNVPLDDEVWVATGEADR